MPRLFAVGYGGPPGAGCFHSSRSMMKLPCWHGTDRNTASHSQSPSNPKGAPGCGPGAVEPDTAKPRFSVYHAFDRARSEQFTLTWTTSVPDTPALSTNSRHVP